MQQCFRNVRCTVQLEQSVYYIRDYVSVAFIARILYISFLHSHENSAYTEHS